MPTFLEKTKKGTTQLQHLNDCNAFEIIKPLNIAKAIVATIEVLASKTRLEELEQELKGEYKDIFELIPHIDELLMTETAWIQLKDEYKKISNRNYPIPWQFREIFSIPIQKRLDCGFIHPLNSPYASPWFIIPKANPKALPHWVCDYHQLKSGQLLIWQTAFFRRECMKKIYGRPLYLHLSEHMSGMSCLWGSITHLQYISTE